MPASASSAEFFTTPGRVPARFTVCTGDRERALLECDFASDDRPALVTALLAAFLANADGAPCETLELWNLPLSTRDLALVHVAAAIDGTDTLDLAWRCPRADCREDLEVSLTLASIDALHEQRAGKDTLTVPGPDGSALTVRRPTGDDLRHWRAMGAADETAVRHRMLRELCVAGTPTDDAPALDEALETFDPLMTLTLSAACPACGHSAEHPLDLEAFALARLHEHQDRLVREIHQLARAYGWSEAEVLAVPRARRARYLELVQSEFA